MSDAELEFARILLFLPFLVIIVGSVVMVTVVRRGAKTAELRHRERMAMIERGMVPSDALMSEGGVMRAYGFKMTLGILLCGLGMALLLLISFAAAEPGVGVGVGGAVATLGLAFVASALSTRPDLPAPATIQRPPAPPAE